MRVLMSFLALVVACPVVAGSTGHRTLQGAVYEQVLRHFGDMGCEETQHLEPASIVIADATVSGNDDAMEQFVREFRGRVIADELIKSYRENGQRSERISSEEPQQILRVLRLDSFMTGDGSYDWDKLNLEYPAVRAIVHISKPALDSTATFAVARYEVITRKGFAWGALQEFQKQADGSWIGTTTRIGDIRVAEPTREKAAFHKAGTQ